MSDTSTVFGATTGGATIIEALVGQTVVAIVRDNDNYRLTSPPYVGCLDGGDALVFTLADGRRYAFGHSQDCCENVSIEDIYGDLDDLIGAPIRVAEERTSTNGADRDDGTTWTFYEFRTIKGSVTVRWCGTSNGYYSESVDHGFLAEREK